MVPWPEASPTACVFILLGLTSVGAEFPPVITYPNQENHSHLFILASPSNDVILNCNATDADPNKDFVWRKNKTHPLPPGWRPTGGIPSNSESSLRAPFPANSITLPAAESSSDPSSLEGSYECVVSNTAGIALSAPVSINFARIAYPENPGTLLIEGHLGSTLRIPCSNSKEPIKFYPNAMSIGVQVMWALTRQSGRSIPLRYEDNNRTMVNELGNLYIRKLMQSDETPAGSTITCTIFNPMAAGSGGVTAGSYKLRILRAYGYPLDAKLVYKTPDFTVAEGASFFLSCIFEDIGQEHFGQPTFVTPGTAKTFSGGGGLYVNNVGPRDSGDYMCRHIGARRTLEEVIWVTVIPYPMTAEMADTYAPIGSLATITCQTRAANSATFRWFFNDEPIFNDTKYHVQTGRSSSVLSILNSAVSDSGVIGCTATNEIGTTRTNGRLIAYEYALIRMNQVKWMMKNGKQYMVFLCNYQLDVRAGNVVVYFTISNRSGKIDNKTNDDSFGIKRPAVVKQQDGGTLLQLAHDSYKGRSTLVNCTCHVEYKILNKALSAHAATIMNTDEETSTVSPTMDFTEDETTLSITPTDSTDITPMEPLQEALQWWMILAIVIPVVVVIVLLTLLSLQLAKKKRMSKAMVSLSRDKSRATKTSQNQTSNKEQSQPSQDKTWNKQQPQPSNDKTTNEEQLQPSHDEASNKQQRRPTEDEASNKQQSQPSEDKTSNKQQPQPSEDKTSNKQQPQPLIENNHDATKYSPSISSSTSSSN